MKINRKGMTITELLVSITMLSVALVLMYGLLSNLQKKKNEEDVKSGDLLKIANLEKTFQDTVMGPCDYGRESVTPSVTVSGNTLSIEYTNGSSYNFELSISDKVVTLKETVDSNPSTTKKWTFLNSCSFIVTTDSNPYNIVIQCGSGITANYIKLPMYFTTL